jgi:hypothetical protein
VQIDQCIPELVHISEAHFQAQLLMCLKTFSSYHFLSGLFFALLFLPLGRIIDVAATYGSIAGRSSSTMAVLTAATASRNRRLLHRRRSDERVEVE